MEKTALLSKHNWHGVLLVGLYLLAIVIANLSVAYFGRVALVVTAFCLIPFDLCTRDVLHERWQDGHLLTKMALLIGAGSLLSFLLYHGSGRVAAASFFAFLVSGWIDTVVYQAAHKLKRGWRMNLSNFFSGISDSLIFPLVAFGSTTWLLSGSQAASKFAGGILWSWVFIGWLRPRIVLSGALPVPMSEDDVTDTYIRTNRVREEDDR